MSAQMLILAYVLALLLGIGALAVHSDLRRRRFRPPRAEDRIFRCDRCGHVYTDDPDVERSRCAHCGRLNGAIEF